MINKANASTKIDIQASKLDAESSTQNIYCGFKGIYNELENIEFQVINELYQTKEDGDIENQRSLSDIQINYTKKNLFYFVNTGSLMDESMGINEFTYGFGAGWKNTIKDNTDTKFDTQLGIYIRSSEENKTIGKGKFNVDYPLSKNTSLISDNELTYDLGNKDDFRTSNLAALELKLKEYLSFKAGFQVHYINKNNVDEIETIKTIKRYFSGITFNF